MARWHEPRTRRRWTWSRAPVPRQARGAAVRPRATQAADPRPRAGAAPGAVLGRLRAGTADRGAGQRSRPRRGPAGRLSDATTGRAGQPLTNDPTNPNPAQVNELPVGAESLVGSTTSPSGRCAGQPFQPQLAELFVSRPEEALYKQGSDHRSQSRREAKVRD
jgi:hypothetical protein